MPSRYIPDAPRPTAHATETLGMPWCGRSDAAGVAAAGDRTTAERAWLMAETLGLSCLYERVGGRFIRLPVHHRQQTEGCEWHGQRVGGHLVRLSFTCEGMRDWAFLAEKAPEAATQLYRQVLGRPEVTTGALFWNSDVFSRTAPDVDDFTLLFRAGSYNPLNAWNTVRGAVHLTRCAGTASPDGSDGVAKLHTENLTVLDRDGTDVTEEVVRVTRRHPASGAALRVEVTAPAWGACTVEDLVLADGGPVSGPGVARLLSSAGGRGDDVVPPPARGFAALPQGRVQDRHSEVSFEGWLPEGPPTLPGALVAAAMSHRANRAYGWAAVV